MKNDDNRVQDGTMEEEYTKHYISLLKYMNDREKAVIALDYNIAKVDYYKNTLNYVEKNGINIYGLLVFGETRDLLEFINNEKIKLLRLMVFFLSKYIN